MTIADVSAKSIAELVSLEGRRAVVTGARGIGNAIARRLAEAGASVLIADRDERVVEEAAEIDRGASAGVSGTVADVTASEDVERVADEAVADGGRLDAWVNDAGIFPVKPALEITDEEWAECLSVDLTGTFYGCRAAGGRMRDLGNGRVIVNIASSLGFRGVPDQASNVAAKWGVRGLTTALATEFGGFGVRVVAIGSGLTRSPGMLGVMRSVDKRTGGDIGADFAATLPLARLGETDDIARGVLFAASDLAMFATGSTILVDGGEVYSAGTTASTDGS